MYQSKIQTITDELANGLWVENCNGVIVEFTTEDLHDKFWVLANVADAIVGACNSQIDLNGDFVFDEVLLRQVNRIKRMVDNIVATTSDYENTISSASEVINDE